MRVKALALVASVVVAAVAAGTGRSAFPTNVACKGTNLSGKFILVPNSQGAGNVLYTLQLRNASKSTCFVTGIPGLRLLGKTGKPLPTHAVPLHPGALTAVKVTLKPGGYAAATARFSPDVPGTGEGHPGNCEPVSYKIQISPSGGGSVVGPVSPPTPVCEHGGMTLTTLVAGKHGPVF